MKTRLVAACLLSLSLLATGCAGSLPPGLSASEYRQWRVKEYYRGHLRPEDSEQLWQLERLARHTGPRCYGAEPAGSYCNRSSPNDYPRDYGSRREVVNPTEVATQSVIRAR